MESLNGRVAVVTGAGSGIGMGLVRTLASEGAAVVCADIDVAAAANTAEMAAAEFGTATLAVAANVADADSVEALAATTYARFGAAHVLCNNAGVSAVGQVWDSPISDWDYVLGVNLMGVVHGIRAFVPRMIAAGEPGHVVNTASMGGLIPVPLKAPYTAAKHAVVGLTKTLRAELLGVSARIGVSVVCPGAVATAMLDTQIARYEDDPTVTPAARQVLDDLKAGVDKGISPDEAGRIIVDGILAGRFWIFPNAVPYLRIVEQEYQEMGISRQQAGATR
jgi:NAD(P)-dependent dehydrogenase (short-subunit alcohol dehydrogenase family)